MARALARYKEGDKMKCQKCGKETFVSIDDCATIKCESCDTDLLQQCPVCKELHENPLPEHCPKNGQNIEKYLALEKAKEDLKETDM